MADGLWWRQTWMEAVYSSDLKPLERLVAVVYADHARDKRQVWVTLPRLMERTGLSRDAANRALRGLRDKGWLLVMQEAKQHRATIYGLVIPESSSTPDVPLSSTADVPLKESSSTPPDTSSTRDDTSSTPRVPNQSSYQNPHQSLSPEQLLVKELLGLDDGDERLMKISSILTANNVRNPKVWLRSCHANGDLLDLLQAETTTSSAWGAKAEDDGYMNNPNIPEGWGPAVRIKVQDYYKPRILDLGYSEDEASAYLNRAIDVYPNGNEETVWREAFMTARTDVAFECCGRQDGKHSPHCDEHWKETA